MSQHPPAGESQRQSKICPFLRATGVDEKPVDAVGHPSFENRCWSAQQPVPLLLTDQATLCLCNAYRQCPRFLAGQAARGNTRSPHDAPAVAQSLRTAQAPAANASTGASPHSPAPNHPGAAPPESGSAIDQALNELESDLKTTTAQRKKNRQRWGWIGAGLIFMSSLLCGGFFAAYVGWQMVNSELMATQPGSIESLASGESEPQTQLYFVVTATSEPAAEDAAQGTAATEADPDRLNETAGNSGPSGQAAEGAAQMAFPEAVTPTPAGGFHENIAAQTTAEPAAGRQQAEQGAAAMPVTGQNAQAPTATSPVNLQMQIPTRRPTPVLDIPTSTAMPADLTAPPTPTPEPLGTPVIEFAAEKDALQSGECTAVSWHVENVRAVYYEDRGVDGQGEIEECLNDESEDYILKVILDSGRTEFYTTTVELLVPTDTPIPTPTFTLEVPPTPTWTPRVPTPTPTPTIHYGAQLALTGPDELTCAPEETCTTELSVTNTSSEDDTLYVEFVEAGAWQRQLCRAGGACNDMRLSLNDIGPGNAAGVTLHVTLPDTPAFDEQTYKLRASSEAADDGGRSQVVTVTVIRQ